ncbi:zf-DHHC-domain-containing protein [Mycena albidolilacea]|uniref:Palmitoyltransferase n=1 Tax=Mycena albidolilacea TaxID=1033008 RepID=A0AAD7E6X5_9AGAR|nr:zf-DHHC-domain-containing protein [Mycena albidolilacea]
MPGLMWPLISGPICVLIALNLWMHYFYVITVPPGFADDPPVADSAKSSAQSSIFWASKKAPRCGELAGVRWSNELVVTQAGVTKCRKCGQQRPERAHHCRISKRRVNQCVGLHNERHFVMFMAYLVIACISLSITGFPHVLQALGAGATYTFDRPHHVPQIVFILVYILAVVMALAVGIMCGFHLWTVAHGETTVESQDHDTYRRMTKARNEPISAHTIYYRKRRNLELFFNVGENGYPLYTLFVPLRINPYTDGRAWARRERYAAHRGDDEGEA